MLTLLALLGFLPVQYDDERDRLLPFHCQPLERVQLYPQTLLVDTDGDRWMKAREIKTGQVLLGFINHLDGRFCQIAVQRPNR